MKNSNKKHIKTQKTKNVQKKTRAKNALVSIRDCVHCGWCLRDYAIRDCVYSGSCTESAIFFEHKLRLRYARVSKLICHKLSIAQCVTHTTQTTVR